MPHWQRNSRGVPPRRPRLALSQVRNQPAQRLYRHTVLSYRTRLLPLHSWIPRQPGDLSRVLVQQFRWPGSRAYEHVRNPLTQRCNRLRRPRATIRLAVVRERGSEIYRCWTAHELGQLIVDLWRIQNLFLGPSIPKL